MPLSFGAVPSAGGSLGWGQSTVALAEPQVDGGDEHIPSTVAWCHQPRGSAGCLSPCSHLQLRAILGSSEATQGSQSPLQKFLQRFLFPKHSQCPCQEHSDKVHSCNVPVEPLACWGSPLPGVAGTIPGPLTAARQVTFLVPRELLKLH